MGLYNFQRQFAAKVREEIAHPERQDAKVQTVRAQVVRQERERLMAALGGEV